MALQMAEPPALPLHLKVLIHPYRIHPYGEGFSAECLETYQATMKTLEEAVRVITKLVDSQLSLFRRGHPMQSLLHKLPPKFYEIFEGSRPYPYQPSLSQEVDGVIGSIEYRVSDEVLTDDSISRYISE